MNILSNLNFGILFLVELAMLASFFMFGMSLHAPMMVRILAAVAIPSAVAVLWGMYFAPKATYDLAQPWNALGEYSLFILGGLALMASGRKTLGIVLIAVSIISETISLFAK